MKRNLLSRKNQERFMEVTQMKDVTLQGEGTAWAKAQSKAGPRVCLQNSREFAVLWAEWM